MSVYNLLLAVLMAVALSFATAEDFELATGMGTIRAEDRDPFKEGYFTYTISCFALMFFFIACMFSVRICLGNKSRTSDSKSFFLVA